MKGKMSALFTMQSFQSVRMEVGKVLRLVCLKMFILILSYSISIQGIEPYLGDYKNVIMKAEKKEKQTLMFMCIQTSMD